MSDSTPRAGEWGSLSADWLAQPVPAALDPVALRARVERETRQMRWWVAVEIAFTAAVLGGGAWALAFHRDAFVLLFTMDAWAMLVLVWAFALWSRRGLWRPAAESTEAYLALARRRAQIRLATAWFIVVVVAAQIAVALLSPGPSGATWLGGAGGRAVAWLVAVVYLALAMRLRSRAVAERRWLE